MAEQTKKHKLTQVQKAYLSRIKNLISNSSAFQSLLLEVRQKGKNFVRQTERLENKQFDDRFVDELEKGFNAIDQIISNPRTFIKETPELVEAGLAKKINAQSITHLASHTQFVHNVDEKGNVTPEKILTIHADVDVQIYENRFVMTLIKKCSLFIQKRFNFIKDHGETLDSDLLLIKSSADIDGAKYEVDTRVKVSTPSADEGNKDKNDATLYRLSVLRERCAYYMRSQFMQDMAGAKDVANPIHMTNLIVKNPHYHAAYELWKFIDAYLELGISYHVTETEQEFTQDYYEEIFALVLADMLTLHSNQIKNRQIENKNVKQRTINPHVLFTLEDETYYDGKFFYDQFPEQRENRFDPMALTPEEAKAERLALEEKIKDERLKKPILDEAIEDQKNKDIALEAIERQKRLEEEERARQKAEEERIKAEALRLAEEELRRREEEEIARKAEQERLEKAREEIERTGREDRKNAGEPLSEPKQAPAQEPETIIIMVPSNKPSKEENPVSEPASETLATPEETKQDDEVLKVVVPVGEDIPEFKDRVFYKKFNTRDGMVVLYKKISSPEEEKALTPATEEPIPAEETIDEVPSAETPDSKEQAQESEVTKVLVADGEDIPEFKDRVFYKKFRTRQGVVVLYKKIKSPEEEQKEKTPVAETPLENAALEEKTSHEEPNETKKTGSGKFFLKEFNTRYGKAVLYKKDTASEATRKEPISKEDETTPSEKDGAK